MQEQELEQEQVLEKEQEKVQWQILFRDDRKKSKGKSENQVYREDVMDGLDIKAGSDWSGLELVGRIEAAAALLERTLGLLEERQRFLSGEVERISATVETTRREEELVAKLAEVERELAELKSVSAVGEGSSGFPKALQPLRKTLPSATAEMLSKHGIGESAVDVRALDAALVGLSLEQRIAVKSQLRRAGAMA